MLANQVHGSHKGSRTCMQFRGKKKVWLNQCVKVVYLWPAMHGFYSLHVVQLPLWSHPYLVLFSHIFLSPRENPLKIQHGISKLCYLLKLGSPSGCWCGTALPCLCLQSWSKLLSIRMPLVSDLSSLPGWTCYPKVYEISVLRFYIFCALLWGLVGVVLWHTYFRWVVTLI